ncbi:uncharacterized protein TNIN_476321 [Trichonephila inaurata madagascariensis]|uniref:Prokineticin domain-containing protein n=1 Tax=Trichonephila inaurata madagascariensis TaxID=2747483 RepID=A0A8X7C9F1_9ARAC|nr:uncharacterized protein TNIN_476321 [Trichonephila inaurata madagascariensis]
MRFFLTCLVAALCVMAASAALTCFGDAEKCGEDECCIQVGNTPAGICRKRHDVDEVCEMKPVKNLFKDHVYKLRCPCLNGHKCVSSKGGLLGKFAGKCQVDSGEEPSEE